MESSPATPRPTAKDIAEDIRQQLVAGTLRPGDQLPAARDLAKENGVTLVKVQNAYRELREEGLVFSQVGRGTFVVDPAHPVPGSSGGGSAFLALTSEVTSLHETIRQLADRLDRLERIVNTSDSPGQ